MKLGRKILLILVTGILFFSSAIQAQEVFRARLSPMPTTPQTVTTILGEGQVILTLNGNSLSVAGNFTGMSSVATGAHIHNGPPAQPGLAVAHVTADGGGDADHRTRNAGYPVHLELDGVQRGANRV